MCDWSPGRKNGREKATEIASEDKTAEKFPTLTKVPVTLIQKPSDSQAG
jgi:hypothetical protein